MSKVALFPGTFDPFTLGHLDIVNRGLNMFDEVVVAIGMNTGKKHMFSLEKREQWIKEIFDNEPRVRVASYEGLTAKYAEQIGAHFILRGLRTNQDFTYEKHDSTYTLTLKYTHSSYEYSRATHLCYSKIYSRK